VAAKFFEKTKANNQKVPRRGANTATSWDNAFWIGVHCRVFINFVSVYLTRVVAKHGSKPPGGKLRIASPRSTPGQQTCEKLLYFSVR
jgi:hypothetical protein